MSTLLFPFQEQFAKAVEFLRSDAASVRTSRATPSLLEHIRADYYGTPTPLMQLGTLSAPDPTMLTIQAWDATAISAITQAIQKSDLGFNPVVDGQLIRIPVPALSEERRQELVKVLRHKSESARVSVRTIREEAMKHIRGQETAKTVSEDEAQQFRKELQKLVDGANNDIQAIVGKKQEEIVRV